MKKSIKQIGIYGGSFDPIHIGHLNLAIEMLEKQELDEVWLCPAALNPHKISPTSASATHRLNMLQLAIANEPRLKICDFEINREGSSYTIDTLEQLHQRYGKQMQFSLIMGYDAAQSFHRWRNPNEIIKLAQLLIGSRHTTTESFQGSPEIVKALEKGLTVTRQMDISSTEVRQRLAQRLYCEHLVPLKVLDYILANNLYFYSSLKE